MDVIILAGGFAKRMWPLTKERPKHLLPIAGRPMLGYTLDPLLELEGIDTVYISTNQAFGGMFREFLHDNYSSDRIKLVVEPSLEEGQKLGAVGGLGYLIGKEGLCGDTMVIGGDNLFEFEVGAPIGEFRRVGVDIVAVYDVGSFERARLYGIVDVGEDMVIKGFLEKPDDPPSTLAATALYVFRADTVKMILRYLDEGGKPDALGHFIAYLVKRKAVHAWRFPGRWFDIGSTESYNEADDYFGDKTY